MEYIQFPLGTCCYCCDSIFIQSKEPFVAFKCSDCLKCTSYCLGCLKRIKKILPNNCQKCYKCNKITNYTQTIISENPPPFNDSRQNNTTNSLLVQISADENSENNSNSTAPDSFNSNKSGSSNISLKIESISSFQNTSRIRKRKLVIQPIIKQPEQRK